MCIITILHCTPCKLRQDMPEEGLIIKKDWHAQVLVNLDYNTVPFKRCVDATNYALSNGRSDTMYPRCRNVEIRHMAVKSNICYRCSTRRRIQNLITMRKLYEQQTAIWRNEERRDTEAVNDMRMSIRESLRTIFTSGTERLSGATASSLTVRRDSIIPMTESWESCLERQILQREAAKAKQAEGQAKLAKEAKAKEKRTRERLASVQQHLSELNTMEHSSVMEGDPGQGPDYERFPRLRSSQDPSASPKRPPPAMPLIVSSDMAGRHRFKARPRTLGVTSALKSHASDEMASVDTTKRTAHSSASVGGISTLRAEAPEFASLRGLPPSMRIGPLRAKAPEFKPLRHAPPTEPQMMRAPTAPRAMREGSVRQASDKPRQKYATMRGYPTLRGWRE
jgi:hypothetical protein